MKFEDLKSQFSVYLLAESSSVLNVEADLAEYGYRMRTLSFVQQVWDSLAQDPPHIIVFEASLLEDADDFLNQLYEKSPETIAIALVENSDEGVLLSEIVYDFIPQAFLRKETLLKSLDRACESLSYLFKIEQLLEVEAQKTSSLEEKKSDFSELSATPVMNEKSVAGLQLRWLERVQLLNDNAQIIQGLMSFFKDELGCAADIGFFRYISRPSRFVLSRSVGIDLDEYRGVGFRLQDTLFSKDSYFDCREIDSQIQEMSEKVFSSSKKHFFPLFESDEVKGLFFICGGLTHTQHVDLFRSLIEVAQMRMQLLKLNFENARQNVFSKTTGLMAREGFEGRMKEELSRSRRQHTPVSLVLLSVDQFTDLKRRTDEVSTKKLLQALSQILRKTSRAGDLVADFDSGEFALLLPETGLNGAAVKAEKIRRIVESAQFSQAELLENKKITISLGASEYPRTSKDVNSLLQSADDALFFIRKQSGNQVCVASAPENFQPDFEAL